MFRASSDPALRFVESGHMVHGGLFRDDGAVRYIHTYPLKNANTPFVGTTKDGAFYPFIELSVVQRPGRFLLEGGMRMNIVAFRFDDYEVDTTDAITHRFAERRVLTPYLFVNLGLELF